MFGEAASGDRRYVKSLGDLLAQNVPLVYRGRLLVVEGLLASAASHLPLLREHFIEAPYLGWLVGVFVVLCVSLTVPIGFHDSRLIYWIVVALCGAAVLVYAAGRLTGVAGPGNAAGRWWDSWPLVAVMSEVFTISTALLALLPPEHGAPGRVGSTGGEEPV
jgi:cell division protein FtsW (lipid II flippase)